MDPFKEIVRCPWCGTDETYVKYHDQEWGVPVVDDQTMFTFLLLETFQAGLSWITILRKKENFARAFANFNPKQIAAFGHAEVEILLQDEGIIRNRQKIEATINNAKRTLEVTKEFGSFCNYWWKWVDFKPINNKMGIVEDYVADSPLSGEISKDLKKRGFKFVGPTTVYAHMQAAGLVNDHLMKCDRHAEVEKLGKVDVRAMIKKANRV